MSLFPKRHTLKLKKAIPKLSQFPTSIWDINKFLKEIALDGIEHAIGIDAGFTEEGLMTITIRYRPRDQKKIQQSATLAFGTIKQG